MIVLELGLVVEQIDVRRSAGHEQVDDAFRLRCEVRRPASGGVHPRRLREETLVEERRQRNGANARGGAAEELAASEE